MGKRDLLKALSMIRRDQGDLLFHFTQSEGAADPGSNGGWQTLNNILKDGGLVGSSKFILGKERCVCFTEAPITEYVSYFRLEKWLGKDGLSLKYQPYGVAVKKRWLFEKGGRPAIYQKRTEHSYLSDTHSYRHCTYEPDGGVDWTWEREWRVRTDFLPLDPTSTIVVVPTSLEAYRLMHSFAKREVRGASNPHRNRLGVLLRWISLASGLRRLFENHFACFGGDASRSRS